MSLRAAPEIVVLGGGFAGLESAYTLKATLGDRASITLISDKDHFLFRPNTIYIPFGLDPRELMIPLAGPAERRGIKFIRESAKEIDPVAHTVVLDGHQISYNYLVVATGAGMRLAEVPGLADHAISVWTVDDMQRLGSAFAGLVAQARAGQRRQVLFLVPPNNKCAGPLYEIVQMLDTWLRRQGVRQDVAITWSTFEAGYIQVFGPRLHDVVSEEFTRRGIEGHTKYVVDQVEAKEVVYRNGERLPYDLLISFPPYVASTPFGALASDDRGFVATESRSRRVQGQADIYAPGDAGDFPVKQAFLAFLQAGAVAADITARIRGEEAKFEFEPNSMCVMEQFDKATFALVPLRVTGDPSKPVELRPEALGDYKVGTFKIWRLGKWLLGKYLPWRFGAGKPFHAGLPWKAMDLGLKIMSRLFAS